MTNEARVMALTTLVAAGSTIISGCALASQRPVAYRVNAIAGDVSFIRAHGRPPNASETANSDERYRTHLLYIARELRSRPTDHLSSELRAKRMRLLDALDEYIARGEFPRPVPDGVPGPRFIDDEGRICPVGYLVEVSAGRGLAETINERYEREYLLNIDDPDVSAWIASSGFTLDELASIQPAAFMTFGCSAAPRAGGNRTLALALLAGAALQLGRRRDARPTPAGAGRSCPSRPAPNGGRPDRRSSMST